MGEHAPTRRDPRRAQGPGDLEGGARGRPQRDGPDPPALRRGDRRRPGRDRARRPAAPARRAARRRRPARPPGRPVAQPLQVAVPARPGLVRPPALHRLPEELAGVRAEGQDRATGWRCTPGSWRSTTGPSTTCKSASYDEATRRVDRRRRPGRRGAHAAARSSWCWPPACRARPTCRRCPARTGSAASSTTARSTPARTPTGTRRSWSSGRTTRRSTSAARSGRPAPT